MLYPKNNEQTLSAELFQNPTSEYRGTPFWAWNGVLDDEELKRQIDIFKTMGLGGFHMHVRTGLDVPYLSEEFMDHIRFCVEEARKRGMLAWLYDEDRWPSGTAGGRVTKNQPENARKTLLLTPTPYAPDRPHRNTRPEPGRGQESIRQDNGTLLAVYDICLNSDGTLASSKRIDEHDTAVGVKWYAYMEYATEDPWFNNCAYVDTLRPEAVRDFLSYTHEKYYKAVGRDFGGLIPAMFTDEPQFTPKETLNFSDEQKDVFMPWTSELPNLYRERYQEDIFDHIPELLWELPNGKCSSFRWKFQNLLTDRFVDSYCRQIGSWCDSHGLSMTGHVMGEPSLESQTQAVGDAMRCYRHFGIPGIDMLCDFHEYTTAKQTQSIIRQLGKEGMLSELYGVTGWDYDFRGYKLQGDWQAALGVTVRVPHLAWMTMKGEAKRDYPAAINYQSPWYDQFSMIEDHFARLNTALTRGKANVRVAVVHPIESYWLHFGPSDLTSAVRAQMEQQFSGLAETLLFGGIDFDYLCEAELPQICSCPGNPLKVGLMEYDVVIVPPLTTIRDTTLSILEKFRTDGGALIFIGNCPTHVNAEPSTLAKTLFDRSKHVNDSPSEILGSLEPYRFLSIRRSDGQRENRILHQLRNDGDGLWLFLCNGKNPTCPDVDDAGTIRITLNGCYDLTLYDTMTGTISALPSVCRGNQTIFERKWYIHESMLLRLTPFCDQDKTSTCTVGSSARQEISPDAKPISSAVRSVSSDEKPVSDAQALPHQTQALTSSQPDLAFGMVPITLEEPNMLLLDMAEYSFNGGPYYSEDELLRIDNTVRRLLDIPVRRKEVVQPYLIAPDNPKDRLTLRFRLTSEISITGAKLALEDADTSEIRCNGILVPSVIDGWYVDRSIKTVALPDLIAGENILEITVPIGRRTNLEYMYLLGDFGVRVCGTKKTLVDKPACIGFSDIVGQGLPFYTGNLLYHFKIRAEGDFIVRIPRYRGGLTSVLLDGRTVGNIAFSPYCLHVPCTPGEHELTIRLYGTRQNGFAQLHHTPGVYFYQSPNSWRSAGDLWCYEYQFKQAGLLTSPELFRAVFLDENGNSRQASGYQEHMTDRS